MDWERRPKSDEPIATQREIFDDSGRRWVGSVSSGLLPGGEENAEVIWVCGDQPRGLKRVADLGVPPGEADDLWLELGEEEVNSVFRESRPA